MCDSVLIYCVSHHDYHVHTSITHDSVIQRSEDESCSKHLFPVTVFVTYFVLI